MFYSFKVIISYPNYLSFFLFSFIIENEAINNFMQMSFVTYQPKISHCKSAEEKTMSEQQ